VPAIVLGKKGQLESTQKIKKVILFKKRIRGPWKKKKVLKGGKGEGHLPGKIDIIWKPEKTVSAKKQTPRKGGNKSEKGRPGCSMKVESQGLVGVKRGKQQGTVNEPVLGASKDGKN